MKIFCCSSVNWRTICVELYEILIALATICGKTTISTNHVNGLARIRRTMPFGAGN
jgi:hypothetical protein